MSHRAKRPLEQRVQSPRKESSVATKVAWGTLALLSVETVVVYLTSTLLLAAMPTFQATLVLIFSVLILLGAGVNLWTGEIRQRILWFAWETVQLETNPRRFWICWWTWLTVFVIFVQGVYVAALLGF